MKFDPSKLIEGRQLTEAETAVLHYIIEHFDSALKLGVRGIAKENFTSTSTVMRLAKKLGYNGFVDMYYKLLPAVKNTDENYRMTASFVDQFYQSALFQPNTLNSDTYNNLRGAAELLYRSGGLIYIYGMGFSSLMAEYLAKKLLVIGAKCLLSTASDSIGVFENNLEDISAVVLFSRSGRSVHVLNRAESAHENNVPVISFTGAAQSPLLPLSDYVVACEDDNPLDDRNMQPTTFFAKNIMLSELLIYEYHRISMKAQ